MANFKLQSAMEYLMTYGWAILIIAVVMVALFSLGILGGSPLGTTCLPQSGFECTNPIYSHSTGQFAATIGQNSGVTWQTANIIFVPQGVPVQGITTSIFTAGNYLAVSGTVNNGQTISVSGLPVNVPLGQSTVAVGQTAAGTIWVQYTTPTTGGTLYYAEIATVTLKAA